MSKGLAWGKKQKPDPPPLWCAKGRPCDYDKLCAYCVHRECRQKLEAMALREFSPSPSLDGINRATV